MPVNNKELGSDQRHTESFLLTVSIGQGTTVGVKFVYREKVLQMVVDVVGWRSWPGVCAHEFSQDEVVSSSGGDTIERKKRDTDFILIA